MLERVSEAVLAVLDEQPPQNVERSAVTITGEGDAVEIVLIPHRDLGGVSLVVWTDASGTDLRWADVGRLDYHDEIDRGVKTARVNHEGDWRSRLRAAVADELHRPIHVRSGRGLFGRTLNCYVTTDRERRVGTLRGKDARLSGGPAVTSLASGPNLGFSIPVPVAAWHRKT